MLEALKFVQGAVSTKNFTPEMKFFAIQDGRVRGFNGMIALSSPIDLDMQCAPLAVPLVRAIDNCLAGVAVGLHLTPAGRLCVYSGAFKAFIPCAELADIPEQAPSGETVQLDGAALLKAMRTVLPFVGTDASRPWSNGVLLRGSSVYATNNVTLIECWTGTPFPVEMSIPTMAVKEMLRIGAPPVSAQCDVSSLTLHYEDGRWLRTQLYEQPWPDLSKILNVPCDPVAVPSGLFEGLAALKPFVGAHGLVYIHDAVLQTHTGTDEDGASYRVEDLPGSGIFNLAMLTLLHGVADRVDFTRYPDPLIFYGPSVRGAIIGRSA
jgi:hypothetical protein